MPVSAKIRQAILQALAFNTHRQELLAKASPAIEEALRLPGVRRAYVGGSFASKKSNPSDIDIILRHDKGTEMQPKDGEWSDLNIEDAWDSFKARGVDAGQHTGNLAYDDVNATGKDWLEEARRRYGKDYMWQRILGAALFPGVFDKEQR